MPFTASSVIPYGLLVMHAMDMYRVKTCPPVPFAPPPPLPGGDQIVGWIMGVDTVLVGHPKLPPGPLSDLDRTVCYGALVRRSQTELVVAIRGTDGYREWLEDAQFVQVPYAPGLPLPAGTPACKVEQGFWDLYRSLALTDAAGKPIGPLAAAVTGLAGAGNNVVVAGHSLGAPLATYLTIDLVRGALGQRVSACFFASPHPGDGAFTALFDATVADYIVYNYVLDFVPRVPTLFEYGHLPKLEVILPDTAEAEVTVGLGCNHHIVCYLAMLDYQATKLALDPVPNGEADSWKCVRGPNTGQQTLAKALTAHIANVA